MANFTTEAAVRLRMQVDDTTTVSTALVEQSIDDAHARILTLLDAGVDTESPLAELVLGETLLAGAMLLRSLASGEATQGRQITIGGNRVDTPRRYATLMAETGETERRAWETLGPFLAAVAPRVVAEGTDSVAVLGE